MVDLDGPPLSQSAHGVPAPSSIRRGLHLSRQPLGRGSRRAASRWGKLTDDDIAQIDGNREQLEGKIQALYGYAKGQVRKDIDDWLRHQ